MIKYLLLIFIIGVNGSLLGQYFNITEEDGQFLLKELYRIDDKVVMPIERYFSDSNILEIQVDIFNNNPTRYKRAINTARKPFQISNNAIYLTGEDAANRVDLPKVIKLEKSSYDVLWDYTYPRLVSSIGQSSACNIGDDVYAMYAQRGIYDSIQILSVDAMGDMRFNKTYSYNSSYMIGFDMEPLDDRLMISLTYNKAPNQFTEVGLMAIDPQGHVLFDKSLGDYPYSGNTAHDLAVLDNGELLMEAWIDQRDPTMDCRRKHKLYWMNKIGDVLREKTFCIPYQFYIEAVDVKASKDGFYLYGRTIDLATDEIYYGFINKYNFEGDTIWYHRYHHPDFAGNERNQAMIWDLIEEEDGLTVLGDIRDENFDQYIWLMRLNDQGCLYEMDCDSLFVVSNEEVDLPSTAVDVFPNPASDRLAVVCDYTILSVGLHDLSGVSVAVPYNKSTNTTAYIDVSAVGSGYYILTVETTDGRRASELIVVR